MIFAKHRVAILALAIPIFAHDIPADVTVQAFLRPSGNKLQLLIRVPLQSMRDIEFPQRGPGYLDFDRSDALLRDAAQLWVLNGVVLYENGVRLTQPTVAAARASLDSNKSFATFDEALAQTKAARFTNDVNVYWNQAMLDTLFEFDIRSANSRFSMEPKFARLGQNVLTVLRFVPSTDVVRAYQFRGDPGLVDLDPAWTQAAGRFVRLGFEHILEGSDHLLFLLCLVIPFRRFFALIPVVTAFTAAHSFTLIASAYNLGPDALWFPPLIETLIAASIVYMALENIVKAQGVTHRWIIAFAFGLVHGFGFSFALRESLQFAGSHLLTSLLAFNIGVELGQVALLLAAVPILELLFKKVVAERMGTIILSAFIAHTGWHWAMERFAILSQFKFEMPAMTAGFWAACLGWAATIVLLSGTLWWIFNISQRRRFASGQ